MKYNSEIHHRQSIRLKGYDYSQSGAYFITICTQDRKCLFGAITDGEMILNEYGKIAYNEWNKLPHRYQHIELDIFQIMPNHIHGIITVGAGLAPAPTINRITISDIVGAYKSLVSNEGLKISKSKNEYMGKLWQRNYYEHIIRDDNEMNRIQEYIQNNPLNWQSDQYNPSCS